MNGKIDSVCSNFEKLLKSPKLFAYFWPPAGGSVVRSLNSSWPKIDLELEELADEKPID